MPVPNRSRDKDGTFREKRGDTLIKNIKDEYPELSKVNGNTKLETLKDKYNTDSLDGVLKAIRKENK